MAIVLIRAGQKVTSELIPPSTVRPSAPVKPVVIGSSTPKAIVSPVIPVISRDEVIRENVKQVGTGSKSPNGSITPSKPFPTSKSEVPVGAYRDKVQFAVGYPAVEIDFGGEGDAPANAIPYTKDKAYYWSHPDFIGIGAMTSQVYDVNGKALVGTTGGYPTNGKLTAYTTSDGRQGYAITMQGSGTAYMSGAIIKVEFKANAGQTIVATRYFKHPVL